MGADRQIDVAFGTLAVTRSSVNSSPAAVMPHLLLDAGAEARSIPPRWQKAQRGRQIVEGMVSKRTPQFKQRITYAGRLLSPGAERCCPG
jgi:hypothetical protein